MPVLENFPLVSQKTPLTSDGRPSENAEMGNRLQESISLGPFMRKFILSTHIATGTRKHKIIRPICTTPRKGYDVINVILDQLVIAPIAFTFLPLVLFLDIIVSIVSFSAPSTSFAIMYAYTTMFFAVFCLIPTLPTSCKNFRMFYSELPVFFKCIVSISLIPTFTPAYYSFFMSIVVCSTFCFHSLFFLRRKIAPAFCIKLNMAFFAIRPYIKNASWAFIEKISSCGVCLSTWAFTLLLRNFKRYNVIHGTSLLLVSSPKGALTPLGHTAFLPPHYTTNQPHKQLYALKRRNLLCQC